MRDQTAIVTGAAGGIGTAIVQELLAAEIQVLGWDIDVSSLQDHPALLTGQLVLVQVDVTESLALDRAVADAEVRCGGVSILVNNAGIAGPTVPVGQYGRDQWDRVMNINLTSVFEICKRLAPAMARRGYGRVINISSVGGVRGIPDACAYSASKAGVIGLTMGLAKEYMRSGVTFNCVAPALIETPLLKQMTEEFSQAARDRIPMGRIGLPSEVAAMVAWIASPKASFTSGAVFDVSGGRLVN